MKRRVALLGASIGLLSLTASAEPPPPDPAPLAGFQDGFFVRDATDTFRLYPRARLNVDFNAFLGRGVEGVAATDGGTGLTTRVFIRRARLEFGGDFFKQRLSFFVGTELGGQPITNANGKTENTAAAAGATPTTDTARYAPVQSVGATASLTDVWISARATPWLNVMVGQFNAPFSMENRTADGLTSFMERNLPIRAFVFPTTKETGVSLWGEVGHGVFNYEVGVFGGDGQNRPQVDNRFDYIGRVFVRPFTGTGGLLEKVQLGASARYGVRDPKYVGYDYSAITTGQGFTLWDSTYKDSQKRLVHILPSGDQIAAGGELRLPISIVELRGEAYAVSNDTREAIDGFQLTNTERLGRMVGAGWYAQLSCWPFGDAFVNGDPGLTRPRSLDLSKLTERTKQGFEVLALVGGVDAKYDGASRGGAADAKTPGSAKNPADAITVYEYGFGATYWSSRFVRTSFNYILYHTPGSGSASNQALVPGNLGKAPDAGAHVLHEIGARVAVQF